MRDYVGLVNDLRITERICRDRMDGEVMLDAATAIEELQAEVKALNAECNIRVKNNMKIQSKNDELRAEVEKYKRLNNALENLLAEDKGPKLGEWIKLDMHTSMEQYECSACETEIYVPECMGEPMYAYCPYCGAKMEGGDKTECS